MPVEGGPHQRGAGQDAARQHLPGHGRRRRARQVEPVSRRPARLRLRARRGGCGGGVEGGGRGVFSRLGPSRGRGRPRGPSPDDVRSLSGRLRATPGSTADIQAAHWLAAMDVDFRVVATKIDKLSRTERARNLKALELTFGMAAAAGLGSERRRIGRTVENDRQPGQNRSRMNGQSGRGGGGRAAAVERNDRQRAARPRRTALSATTAASAGIGASAATWSAPNRADSRRQPAAATAEPPAAARRRRPAGRRRARHAEGHERHRADQDRQAARRARRHRHAQAGADLPDPARPRREERPAVLGRRARDPARRLRLPARPRLQLPARPRRHLRLPLPDPQVRPAHRRHGRRARSGRRRKASATSR